MECRQCCRCRGHPYQMQTPNGKAPITVGIAVDVTGTGTAILVAQATATARRDVVAVALSSARLMLGDFGAARVGQPGQYRLDGIRVICRRSLSVQGATTESAGLAWRSFSAAGRWFGRPAATITSTAPESTSPGCCQGAGYRRNPRGLGSCQVLSHQEVLTHLCPPPRAEMAARPAL